MVVAGDVSVLNNLKRKENGELVRSVIEEFVEHEGPIFLPQLARLTGWAFGLGRVKAKRIQQINHQVGKTTATNLDGWVWPAALSASEWTEFRPNASTARRRFGHIAPQEIRNASDLLRTRHPEESEDNHRRRVLRTFGKKRMTQSVRAHLDLALGD